MREDREGGSLVVLLNKGAVHVHEDVPHHLRRAMRRAAQVTTGRASLSGDRQKGWWQRFLQGHSRAAWRYPEPALVVPPQLLERLQEHIVGGLHCPATRGCASAVGRQRVAPAQRRPLQQKFGSLLQNYLHLLVQEFSVLVQNHVVARAAAKPFIVSTQ